MKELVTIVIPLFNDQLSEVEIASLEQCENTLGQFPIIAISGDDINLDFFSRAHPSISIYRFENDYFKDRISFQKLLFRDDFYDRFDWCEFLLIHELNSYILKNELRYWCKQGFDFIQPCPESLTFTWRDSFVRKKLDELTKEQLHNNGLSLRRVLPIRKAIKKNKRQIFKFFSEGKKPMEAVFWEEQNHKLLASLITPTPIVRKRFARHSPTVVTPEELFAVTGLADNSRL